VENAPESGPAKKPTPRANARPSGTARKPPPVRKPAARKPAAKPKPPAAKKPVENPVVEAPQVDTPPVEAVPVDEEAVVAPIVDEVVLLPEVEVAADEPAADEPVDEAGATGVAPEVLVVEELAAAEPEVAGAEASVPAATLAVSEELFAPRVQESGVVLAVSRLTKRFDDKTAVDGIDLTVQAGAFYGIVGPNGAGKTTTLSMITGLLRPDSGTITVHGADVWTDTVTAKRSMGVLPDRLRLFDRLTGAQLLYYAGVLRGLDGETARSRTHDLAAAFGLDEALGRLVSDYSAGMTKKIALAAAMIHSPRLLVLDEPFESVDPVSAATVTAILKKYAAAGGTVVLSSHSMDLVQRICDNVAVVVRGRILADGTMDEVRDGRTLEERFVELAGSRTEAEGLEWLHSFSD
jgi:ABC-2 type transport system ATP-binding protein